MCVCEQEVLPFLPSGVLNSHLVSSGSYLYSKMCHLQETQRVQSLTDNLQTTVSMKLSDVSRAEPPLAFLIHKEICTVLLLLLIITHGYVRSTNQNLSSWTGFICAPVTTYIQTHALLNVTVKKNCFYLGILFPGSSLHWFYFYANFC